MFFRLYARIASRHTLATLTGERKFRELDRTTHDAFCSITTSLGGRVVEAGFGGHAAIFHEGRKVIRASEELHRVASDIVERPPPSVPWCLQLAVDHLSGESSSATGAVKACDTLAQLALGGQTLFTATAWGALSRELQRLARFVGPIWLPDTRRVVDVYGLPIAASRGAPMLGRALPNAVAAQTLHLQFGADSLVVYPTHEIATIGRAPGASIRIPNVGIARLHASICWRHGQFFLRDRDGGGTWIIRDDLGSPAVTLHGTESQLVGSGYIAFERIGPGITAVMRYTLRD